LLQVIEIVAIVNGSGPDSLLLTVALPNGVYPYTGQCVARIDVAHGEGEAYMAKHFHGIPCRVVDLGTTGS